MMERASGILMPITALPSPYGIGTLGKAAYEFADFLKQSGQKYWQILPLNPTGYGDSPYQCYSSFAGNPYLIDLDLLREEGLLTAEEICRFDFGSDPEQVDYGKLFESRILLLSFAKKRGMERDREKVLEFCRNNEEWLNPYTEFMSLKIANGMKSSAEWTVRSYDDSMRETRELFMYLQYLFFSQWNRLKEYVNSLGILLIGDVPIYVSYDSAECWAEPENFLLKENREPEAVSGVPPDYFSEDGQLWGNPIYNYRKMEEDGFGWWIRRIGGASVLYDRIRLDHFRGFASYWSVPFGEKTAKNGHWEKGPGEKLVNALTGWFGKERFIAEDLGTLTEDVTELLRASELPGMKVLEFAFDGQNSPHLPYHYKENSVCYTGTHDNAPVMEWEQEASAEAVARAKEYCAPQEGENLAWAMIRQCLGSVSFLSVIPMQDWLSLGREARMNKPGTSSGNWTWRLKPGALTIELSQKIEKYTKTYGR